MAVIDAREIPAEWIVRELRQVCGPQCPVDIQEHAMSLLHQDDEEDARHSVDQSGWEVWRAYMTPARLATIFQPLGADDVNCADHPLALGCDGLLVLLAAILAILVGIKAATRASQR